MNIRYYPGVRLLLSLSPPMDGHQVFHDHPSAPGLSSGREKTYSAKYRFAPFLPWHLHSPLPRRCDSPRLIFLLWAGPPSALGVDPRCAWDGEDRGTAIPGTEPHPQPEEVPVIVAPGQQLRHGTRTVTHSFPLLLGGNFSRPLLVFGCEDRLRAGCGTSATTIDACWPAFPIQRMPRFS
jgi:hypothetical protein